jgi:hypothetical protein
MPHERALFSKTHRTLRFGIFLIEVSQMNLALVKYSLLNSHFDCRKQTRIIARPRSVGLERRCKR